MDTPYLGMIMIWAPNFAPQSWAFCAGQLMPVNQNTALYSLLGTTYGGDGHTSFGLPNLQGGFPIGAGNAPGGSHYLLGQAAGHETTTLVTSNMPQHIHEAGTLSASTQAWATRATDHNPTDGKGLAASTAGTSPTSPPGNSYADPSGDPVDLAGGTISGSTAVAGGSQPFSNMPPYLALNFVIALSGIYPPRP
ncbi:MAG: tail fiber protein [Salinarimonas sp.]|nr:tail fiber protein [Salinarimonas sp.]